MKDPLGCLSTQESPSAVISFLKILLHLFQPPNLVWLRSQNKKMFTNTDLNFCYGQAQTALLPYDFLLLGVSGSNRRRHHNDLGVLPCNSCSEKLSVFLVLRSTGAATESP